MDPSSPSASGWQRARYWRCQGCDALLQLPAITRQQRLCCPRCHVTLPDGESPSLSALALIALAILIVSPFAFGSSLIAIRLLGTTIGASVIHGVMRMVWQGEVLTASMVMYCALVMPLWLATLTALLPLLRRRPGALRLVLLLLGKSREWCMPDIYLVAISVSAIKVHDYADVLAQPALLAFVALTLLMLYLLASLDLPAIWLRYFPCPSAAISPAHWQACHACGTTATLTADGRCARCHQPFHHRIPGSVQRAWAALLSAMVLLLPANLLPISVVYLNGARSADTIMSGVRALATDNLPIAMVVFTASILVPLLKIIILLGILLSLHWQLTYGQLVRMRLLRFIRWIGRWSMLDLFVISLMMSLIDRDLLFAFTMGPAALFFGASVILTILAVEWLDSRLIWDSYEETETGRATDGAAQNQT